MAVKKLETGGLALTLRRGEAVLIADNCAIGVSRIKDGVVTLNLIFPKDIPIDRPDLRDTKRITNHHKSGRVVFQEGPINGTDT